MKFQTKQSWHKLALFAGINLSLLFLLAGCETSSLKNPISQKDQTNRLEEALVSSDPAIDRAEKKFENQISAQVKKTPLASDDLWDHIAYDFSLIKGQENNYKDHKTFYLKRTTHLERTSVRAKPYLYFIYQEVKAREMPMEIALLPIVESGFFPYSKSRMQAAGLWQFIPSTGRIYGLKQDWWFDGRQDVYMSTHAALDFLQSLYVQNNEDWLLALASYNAGYGRILQATKSLKADKPKAEVNFWNLRPYLPKETRNYVPQLLAVSDLIQNREEYGLNIEPIANEPYLAHIELDKQFDLKTAAKLLDISADLIKHLNPGYLREVTPPDGPHHLLIPAEKQASFTEQVASSDDIFSIRWQRHYIVRGDSLGKIAQRYKTSTREIQRLNQIKGNTIHAGKTLLIPIPAGQEVLLASAETKPSAKSTLTAHIHQVKRGESLWTIAHYYGVETTEIASWNNIDIKHPIQVGQKLKVYGNNYGYLVKHSVKDGESLWRIARRYDTTVQDISRWNNLNSKKPLQPGSVLKIWQAKNSTVYTVKKGDTIWDIAKAFNINSDKLQKHNNLSQNSYLQPGQQIRIPN